MVGLMMTENWGVKAENLLASVKTSSSIQMKINQLLKLKEVLLRRDSSLIPEFVPLLAELHDDLHSPVRRLLAEIIGEVGSKHIELLPEMAPTLIFFLKDEAPAVARQAITSGTLLFRVVLEKIAIEGLHSPRIDIAKEASWECMLNFKEAVSHIALQPGIDGVRLLAIKFLEAMILLYTPDPSGSSSPPQGGGDDVNLESVFNVSWLRGGHSILKVGDLSTVASQSLGVLLDQLRSPQVKSLSNSIIMVLINCLSAIAKKRPSFYGRILPVLLSLDPSNTMIRGVKVSSAFHALKHAFSAFLKCTHTGAAPWRARVVEALKNMNAGKILDQAAPDDICGSELSTDDSLTVKEEPFALPIFANDGGQARKRIKVEEVDESVQEDDMSTKRAKHITATTFQEIARESYHDNPDNACDNVPSNGVSYPEDGDNGPVHQLVGIFGALAAQGDKASDSLNILISSTSSDLLAEVVLANMRHLPPACPKAEKEDDLTLNMTKILGSAKKDQSISPAATFVSSILSLSSMLSLLLNVEHPTRDTSSLLSEGEQTEGTALDANMLSSNLDKAITGILNQSYHESVPQLESIAVVSSCVNDMVSAEGEIPGLGLTDQVDSIDESRDESQDVSSVDLQGENHEQNISLGGLMPETTSSGSMSTCVSEAISARAAYMDTNEVPSTVLNPVSSSKLFALPKMTTPVIELDDEQKDDLHKNAYLRVIGAFKQISLVGGTNILFSLLACLGVECPLDLEVWGLLQKHILSDYVNHEGHELTLRVLYRLFRESEQEQDFFSSTTATSDYDKFLLTVAENLLDLFPSSDKSLSKLLCEVPYLPKSVLKLLEHLCCPGSNEKDVKDFQSGDRVTQGLIAVWNVIMQRPPNRETSLKIALQSAVHHLEEVRMKAIRLVANKLFPMSSITRTIEDFANEMLLSVVHILPASEDANTEEPLVGSNTDIGTEMGDTKVSSSEISAHPQHPNSALLPPFSSVSEAQRRMSLYFALCTKKHSLLQQIFAIYDSMPNSAKEAVQGHIPILVRTTGASGELLGIISDPPAGSQGLLMQVLHTLTDGPVPSQELISSVKRLYDTKLKDVEILIPILSSLSKHEIFAVFPQIVDLSPDKFQDALSRILKGSPHSGPVLTPEEVLIAIHGIDPEKDGVALKKVMDACTSCFEQRQVFTQQVLAKALNQLVVQTPLPLLFMRTVIQAIGTFPALVDFVMEILSRLVNKQIWKYPKLWVGFLKCAVQTKPQSFNVLLQLPATQLENALKKNPILKAPIAEHANQPSIRQKLPRSTLVVLGLAQDLQASGVAQTSQTIVAETNNSVADVSTEPTQDSTSVS